MGETEGVMKEGRERERKGERVGGKMHKYNSSVRQNYKSWLK